MNKQTGIIRVSMTASTLAAVALIYMMDSSAASLQPLESWWQGQASSQMAFGVLGQSLPAVCLAFGMVLLTALWRSPSR